MLFAFLPLWLSIAWWLHRSLPQPLIAPPATRRRTESEPERTSAAIHFHPQQGDASCPM